MRIIRDKRVKFFAKSALVIIGVAMCFIGCKDDAGTMNADEANTASAGDIAQTVSKDVGAIGKTMPGVNGAPIIVLEEMHTSRAGQIELAIILSRLYNQFQLRDIALEGYLKERSRIDTTWFINASRKLSATERTSVAAQWLYEGEVSAAEFMKLIYDDIILHPIETANDYPPSLSSEDAGAPFQYLFQIAQLSLKASHIQRLNNLQEKMDAATGERLNELEQEYMGFIHSIDPWVEAKHKSLTEAMQNLSLEKVLTDIEEIDQHAKQAKASLDTNLQRAMNASLEFWRGRVAASVTMVENAARIADDAGVKVIALNVGAAHTDGMATMLAKQTRSFAVIRPIALKSPKLVDDLGDIGFQRKLSLPPLSVFPKGISMELCDLFQKKPEPILNEPWLEAKGELYFLIAELTEKALSGNGDGMPPFGFADNDLRGKYVSIDPKDISLVPDDAKDPKSEKAVLFPVVLTNPRDSRKKELWVKAGRSLFPPDLDFDSDSLADSERVEKMLMHLLQKVLQEGDLPENEKEVLREKAEDDHGGIQIDHKVRAIFGVNKEAVNAINAAS